MPEQSIRMKDIKLSRIREIMNYCAGLRKEGRVILDFTNGEPDFVTPDCIRNAAKEALDAGITGYAPTVGVEALRRAVAMKLRRDNGLTYSADEILITNGGTQGAFLAMAAFLNPGDEVLLPNPGFTIYPEIARFCGAEIRYYRLKGENAFEPDPSEIEGLLTDKTKMLLLISPSNPIGSMISRKSLEKLADLIRDRDLLVLSDEIYERIVYDGAEAPGIASVDGMKEKTIILNGFSKTYAMTGWRLGYVAAPEKYIEPMMRLGAITTCGATNFSQWAAVAAIEQAEPDVEKMRREYEERRDFVTNRVNAIDLFSCRKPEGAFYAFIDISKTGMGAEEFVRFMIDKESCALVPGTAFGTEGEGYVRLCFAKTIEQLGELMDRLEDAALKIKQKREEK